MENESFKALRLLKQPRMSTLVNDGDMSIEKTLRETKGRTIRHLLDSADAVKSFLRKFNSENQCTVSPLFTMGPNSLTWFRSRSKSGPEGEIKFPSYRFSPQSKNRLASLTVRRTETGEQIAVLELSMEQFAFNAPDKALRAAARPARRRAPIPGPTEFAISFKQCIEKVAAACPLCGHTEVQEDREKDKIPKTLNHMRGMCLFLRF
jgi:hypothetical protein